MTDPFEPVRKKITVNAPIETAFEVFTTGMGAWWNREHSSGGWTALSRATSTG